MNQKIIVLMFSVVIELLFGRHIFFNEILK